MIDHVHTLPEALELLDDPLFQAAELRAQGNDWALTAKKMNMDCRELRAMALAASSRYQQLFADAEREFFRDTGRESINFVRKHMRDENVKISLGASGDYLRFLGTIIRHGPKAEAGSGAVDFFDLTIAGQQEVVWKWLDQMDAYDVGPAPATATASQNRKRESEGEGDDDGEPNRPVKTPPRDPSGAGYDFTLAP